MRFAISLGWCGYSLDFIVGPTEDDEPVQESVQDVRGDSLSTVVGFVRSPLPDWDDPGSYHTLDPGEDE